MLIFFLLGAYEEVPLVILGKCGIRACVILQTYAAVFEGHSWMCANYTIPCNVVDYCSAVVIKYCCDRRWRSCIDDLNEAIIADVIIEINIRYKLALVSRVASPSVWPS